MFTQGQLAYFFNWITLFFETELIQIYWWIFCLVNLASLLQLALRLTARQLSLSPSSLVEWDCRTQEQRSSSSVRRRTGPFSLQFSSPRLLWSNPQRPNYNSLTLCANPKRLNYNSPPQPNRTNHNNTRRHCPWLTSRTANLYIAFTVRKMMTFSRMFPKEGCTHWQQKLLAPSLNIPERNQTHCAVPAAYKCITEREHKPIITWCKGYYYLGAHKITRGLH